MTYDLKKVRTLYKKLLAFYPRGFKEQLGESMEQTFSDLYNERKQQVGRGMFGFVLITFLETGVGILKEHIVLLTQGDPMKKIFTDLRSPALISFLLVLPFMILELLNRWNFHEGFPVTLFGVLWLLPVAFIFILMPIVRDIRTGKSILVKPIELLLRVAFLAFITFLWVGILIDQMPCFLGVPFCD